MFFTKLVFEEDDDFLYIDEKEDHCCDTCPAMHICFEVVLGAVDEFFLQTYGLEVEVVWPTPGRKGGGVLRAFRSFNHCAREYEGLINIAFFDNIAHFVRHSSSTLSSGDPFDVKLNYGLEPLEQISEK